ncbi:MAG: alpha/beta hydrolase [Desulfuromonadales bacterium]|nr:alpha/beta hydrolase [Desulfuromonadales bacterium]
MASATVFFSHGKESGPWGLKIRALAKVAERFSCRVVSLDDQDTYDPDLRAQRLIDAAKGTPGLLILVGSSMGGYVSTVASSSLSPSGLFLMAPAIGLSGYAVDKPVPVADELTIVHGWDDTLIPFDPVLKFARENRAVFCTIPAGHTLNEQIGLIEEIFAGFLSRCLGKPSHGTVRERLLASI